MFLSVSIAAAKQEAFEESIKLKHQFPTLNDDEADFLYSALEAERAKEQAIRKETSDQLEAFRRRQVEADKVGEGSAEGGREDVDDGGERRGDVEDAVDWSVAAKKRKRTKEKDGLMGFKVRRTSSSAAANHAGQDEEAKEPESANLPMKVLSASSDGKKSEETSTGATTAKSAKLESSPGSLATGNASSPMKAAIGLVGYDSDDDED